MGRGGRRPQAQTGRPLDQMLVQRREEQKRQICEILPSVHTLTAAAESVGVHPATVYAWLDQDPEFFQAYTKAKEVLADKLEEVCISRAIDKSDLLMIFSLKGLRPEKYADKHMVAHKHTHEIKRANALLSALNALADVDQACLPAPMEELPCPE